MKKSISITYELVNHYRELAQSDQDLIAEAYRVCDQAYAPYSKFQVGAVLKMDNGFVLGGNNQENIAYPSGLCAERVALFYAGANHADQKIQSLVVVAKGDLVGPDNCLSPCGSCRQVIAETEMRQKSPIRILLVSQSGKTYIFDKIADLLIFPFGMD